VSLLRLKPFPADPEPVAAHHQGRNMPAGSCSAPQTVRLMGRRTNDMDLAMAAIFQNGHQQQTFSYV